MFITQSPTQNNRSYHIFNRDFRVPIIWEEWRVEVFTPAIQVTPWK